MIRREMNLKNAYKYLFPIISEVHVPSFHLSIEYEIHTIACIC